MKRNSIEPLLAEIKALLASRLHKPGIIKTKEAWCICKLSYAYSSFCQYFRIIMMRMVTHKKAIYSGPGTWLIKPNF